MQRTQRLALRALQLVAGSAEPYSLVLFRQTSKILRDLDVRFYSQVRYGAWRPAVRAIAQPCKLPASTRVYSTEGGAASEDEIAKAKFVRFFVMFMMMAAGVRVAPYIAAASVGNTLGLLDAQEAFLLKSGISRLLLVVKMSDSGRQRALEGGAVVKLMRLVNHEDPVVVDAALMALETLGESELGLEEIREVGGEAVLVAYLRRTARAPGNEDAIDRAQMLLGDLRRPRRRV